MYIYSDLIKSLVVGDVQANLLRMIVPRGQPGEMVAEEIKIPALSTFVHTYVREISNVRNKMVLDNQQQVCKSFPCWRKQ